MNPVIFSTPLFTLHTIWLFFAIAFVIFFYTIIRRAIHNGLKIQFLSENFLPLFLWSLLGARIFSLIENYQNYFFDFSLQSILPTLYIWDKGLSLWGGAIAFAAYLYILCKKNDQNFFKWLDSIIPSLIMSIGIWDLGAFFDGTNYGNESSLPWAVNFDSPAIKYAVPIHPTQIYALLYSALIVGILIFLEHQAKVQKLEKKGFIALCGINLYSFFFFLENFVRGDDTLMIFDIRIPQILSLIVFISSGIFLYLRYNQAHKHEHSEVLTTKTTESPNNQTNQ